MRGMATVDRIIGLIDMDCFYVQVHQREEPEKWGKPCAVVQYTGGGVIAVNYEARGFGIRRGFTVPQCIGACREVTLFRVPEVNSKGDLSKYRKASEEVFSVIAEFDPNITVEKASIDECYLDLTMLCNGNADSYEDEDISDVRLPTNSETLTDCEDMKSLIMGAKIIRRLRRKIKEETQFTCSAGVSFNKVLAKLACSIQKPNGESVISPSCVPNVYSRTPISSVRGLGGKLGNNLMNHFKIEMMSQLSAIPKENLCEIFGSSTANWVSDLSRGIDLEPVTSRSINKSIGCGKNFQGLKTKKEVLQWMENLIEELIKRLLNDRTDNRRTAKNVIVSIRQKRNSFSRTIALREYSKSIFLEDVSKQIVDKLPVENDKLASVIVNISFSAFKFVEYDPDSIISRTPSVKSFFKNSPKNLHNSTMSTPSDSSVNLREPSPEVQIIESNTRYATSDCLMATTTHNPLKRKGFFYRKTEELLRTGKLLKKIIE